MKFKILFVTFLLTSAFSFSQVTSPLKRDADQAPEDKSLVLEKIYLHTDKLNYVSGEDIWYKAYLVDAENNQFTAHSNNLYVELISPDKEIIQRQNIHIFEGKGHGDFHLDDDLKTGKYYLRAYSNWMRNFEETIFYKPIQIVQEENTDDSIPDQQQYHKAAIDLQFFPEGGSLLSEVESEIAFKAINQIGKSIEVEGFITNSINDTLISFKSSHEGMGKFSLTPSFNETYYAKGTTSEGLVFSVKLPKAFETGITLDVLYTYEDQIIVSIKTNQESLNLFSSKEFILKNTCNQLFSQTSIKLKSLSQTLILPVYDFPQGIAKLTLTSTDSIPFAERLVFIPKQQDAKIEIKPDSLIYSARSKVNLYMEIEGEFVADSEANFSLSVIDQSAIKNTEAFPSNIASYFLLESEVLGHIENPGYYFDPENKNRFEALDLLLMTQAWRDFKWKYQSNSLKDLNFAVENEFSLVERLRLYIDSTINPPPEVELKTQIGNSLSKAIIEDIQQDAFYRKMIKTRYGLNDTVVLEEFEKVATKIDAPKKDEHVRIYETVKKSDSYEMTGYELGYKNIVEFLRGRFAGLEILGQEPNIIIQIRGPGSLLLGSEPLWLLDGMPVERDRILDFPVEEVDKIEVLKSGAQIAIFGLRGKNGVISVLSKQVGYGLDKISKTEPQKILGKYDYFKQRQFYAPKYEYTETEKEVPDLRTTIHWEPYIYTDENNKSSIQFFNADKGTIIEIQAEGLTKSGIPIIGKASYEVK